MTTPSQSGIISVIIRVLFTVDFGAYAVLPTTFHAGNGGSNPLGNTKPYRNVSFLGISNSQENSTPLP